MEYCKVKSMFSSLFWYTLVILNSTLIKTNANVLDKPGLKNKKTKKKNKNENKNKKTKQKNSNQSLNVHGGGGSQWRMHIATLYIDIRGSLIMYSNKCIVMFIVHYIVNEK